VGNKNRQSVFFLLRPASERQTKHGRRELVVVACHIALVEQNSPDGVGVLSLVIPSRLSGKSTFVAHLLDPSTDTFIPVAVGIRKSPPLFAQLFLQRLLAHA